MSRLLAFLWDGPVDLPRSLKLEWRITLGRWIGIAFFAAALALTELDRIQLLVATAVLVAAAAFNASLMYLIRREPLAVTDGYLSTIGDGVLCAVMITVLGGFESPFYAILYTVTISAGMRLGYGRSVAIALAIASFDALGKFMQGQPLDSAYIVRSGVLLLTVLLTSYLYEETQQAEAALAERLDQAEALNTALEHRALHDLLTDLPNRTLLYQRVQQAILANLAPTTASGVIQVALMVIDLDRFKEVNDTFGHQYGDLLLQQIGPRLRRVLESSGTSATIARLGGDEFAVLVPRTDALGAERLARQILAVLDESFELQGYAVEAGASIGIALSPEHGADADVLLRRADVAMYVAKRSNRGVAVYAAEQDQHSPDRLALVGELRRAIENDELTLYYQPQVSLRTGACVGVEALVRWQHPQRGLLPPDQFIPLAEQTGLIKSLSRWVLAAALRQSKVWLAQGLNFPIAVNLSMRDLHDAELPQAVADLLLSSGVAPTGLVVEITENDLMADPARALETVTGLRAMAIRITIDDFGTGYSSLAYLKRLPVDELKIDRSFVRDLSNDKNDLAIVRSTIGLGHDLGLSIVAEGVQDAATWDLLRQLGCDVAQGLHIGRPVAPAELVEQLRMRAAA